MEPIPRGIGNAPPTGTRSVCAMRSSASMEPIPRGIGNFA